jgi:hypothetical protein
MASRHSIMSAHADRVITVMAGANAGQASHQCVDCACMCSDPCTTGKHTCASTSQCRTDYNGGYECVCPLMMAINATTLQCVKRECPSHTTTHQIVQTFATRPARPCAIVPHPRAFRACRRAVWPSVTTTIACACIRTNTVAAAVTASACWPPTHSANATRPRVHAANSNVCTVEDGRAFPANGC